MNLEIDKSILDKFWDEIKVFFYEAWCEWTKINITEDFEKDWLSFFELNWKKVFYEKKDENNLDSWKIFPKKEDNLEQNSEHSENDKYLFISPKVKWRCGCATSFSFERKLIDKDKLNKLKNVFRK
jgi:hypothetical protein